MTLPRGVLHLFRCRRIAIRRWRGRMVSFGSPVVVGMNSHVKNTNARPIDLEPRVDFIAVDEKYRRSGKDF